MPIRGLVLNFYFDGFPIWSPLFWLFSGFLSFFLISFPIFLYYFSQTPALKHKIYQEKHRHLEIHYKIKRVALLRSWHFNLFVCRSHLLGCGFQYHVHFNNSFLHIKLLTHIHTCLLHIKYIYI